MNDQIVVTLVQNLAWPFVALIAYAGLKKDIVRLATGASDLKELLKDPEKLAQMLKNISDTVEELKKETKDTRGSVDVLVIKEENKVSKEENKDLPAGSPDTVNLTTDQMFKQIQEQWDSIVKEIKRRAADAGVKINLIGNVGVNTSVDNLVGNGAMPAAAAALVKQVSNRWQPMFRNKPRMSEWLTPEVYASFMLSAEQARMALASER